MTTLYLIWLVTAIVIYLSLYSNWFKEKLKKYFDEEN